MSSLKVVTQGKQQKFFFYQLFATAIQLVAVNAVTQAQKFGSESALQDVWQKKIFWALSRRLTHVAINISLVYHIHIDLRRRFGRFTIFDGLPSLQCKNGYKLRFLPHVQIELPALIFNFKVIEILILVTSFMLSKQRVAS